MELILLFFLIGGYVAETAGGNFTPHVLTVNPGEVI
jgi:hypothetical protein